MSIEELNGRVMALEDAPAGGGGSLTITELDGVPSVAATSLVFPNGSLSVVGTVVTYTARAFTYASTSPGSPTAGDEWVDSDTGIRYEYINDGTSSQWVEL